MANSFILSPITNGVSVILSGNNSSVNSSLQNYSWVTGLASGINTQFISYPIAVSSLPTTITPFLQNSIDNYIYLYNVSNITQTGFSINFSDNLKSTGYNLSVEIFV